MARKFLKNATPKEILDSVSAPLLEKAQELYDRGMEITQFLTGTGRTDRQEFEGAARSFISGIRAAQRALHGRPDRESFLVAKLRQLECENDGKCVVCGSKTYRDSCVVLRPGYWATPASFHKSGCALARVLGEFTTVVIEDEKVDEELDRPAQRKFAEELRARLRSMGTDEGTATDHE